MTNRSILNAEVIGNELRGYPLKHHVYVIRLRWSTGLITIIYRRYSQFFDFQCRLLDTFPKEAGLYDHTERIIPFIPGKVLIGQSLKKKTVEYRQHALNTYCQRLVHLPAHISQYGSVLKFFETKDSDLKHLTDGAHSEVEPKKLVGAGISSPLRVEQFTVLANYVRQSSSECSLTAGSTVEVIDKKDTGWWFVQTDDAEQGWVPATYLAPLYESVQEDHMIDDVEPTSATVAQSYVCCNDYSAAGVDELSLQRGVVVKVIKKSMDGWWKMVCNGKVGFGPAANLVRANSRKADAVLKACASAEDTATPPPVVHRRPPPRRVDPPVVTNSSRTKQLKPERPPALPKRSVKKLYQAIGDYEGGSTDDSLSLSRGQVVELIEKNPGGWWYVRGEGCIGWAPSTYLTEARLSVATAAATPAHPSHGAPTAAATVGESSAAPLAESKPLPQLPLRPSRPLQHDSASATNGVDSRLSAVSATGGGQRPIPAPRPVLRATEVRATESGSCQGRAGRSVAAEGNKVSELIKQLEVKAKPL